jgi:hypothetical protein
MMQFYAKKLTRLFLTCTLLIIANFGWGQNTYTLVTTNDQLVEGEKYILIGRDGSDVYGLSWQNTNNRPHVALTENSGEINTTPASINSDQTRVYELTLLGSSGSWNLFDAVNNTYLRPRTGTNNGLQGQANTTNANWTIDISGTGAATLVCENTTTYPRNILRYNFTSSLFACYASGQRDVFLYKLIVPPTLTPSETLLPDFGAVNVGSSSSNASFTISGSDLTGNVTVTAPEHFELSKNGSSGWTDELTYDVTAGEIDGQPADVFVRFTPITVGAKSGNITIASTGATTQNVAVEGTGTSANSADSDIIVNGSFTYPQNIAYIDFQAASNLTTSNAIEVVRFTIRDGGFPDDADELSTILNEITFSVTDANNVLRTVALFDGSTRLAEQAAGSTLKFTGLTLEAPDNGTKDFSVYVTFNSSVTDNSQFSFEITSTVTDPTGSLMANIAAGGASTSTTGNINRINVTADRLAFVQQPSNAEINEAMSPAVTVEAIDANNNRDLDFTGNINITSSGTLSGSPITQSAASGLASFAGLTHTAGGTALTLSAASTGLTTAESNTFNIFDICGFEDFNNSNLTATYNDGSFVGNNGVTWSYVEARNENNDANGSGIEGNAIMLRRLSDNSRITSSSITGGIGNFSVKLYKGFTGSGNRQVELFVNEVSQGTSTPFDNFDEQIFEVNNINIAGNIVIEIRNITGNQVILDDITWTCFTIPSNTVLSDNGAQVSAGNVEQGEKNHLLSSFRLSPSDFDAELNELEITTAGTYVADDIENLKLWYSDNSTLNTETATLVKTLENPAAAGTKTFDGFTQNTPVDEIGYFFITADFACNAEVNNTISINAISDAHLSFENEVILTGSASAAGAQTVVALSVVENVTDISIIPLNGEFSILWTDAEGCFDDVIIVVSQGAANTGTPSGTSYTADLDFSGSGEALGNGKVVYQGNDKPQLITGLTNETQYFVKVFTRFGSTWSSGVEESVTPDFPIYTWTGAENNNWNNRDNWSPIRFLITPSDVLVFDNASTNEINLNVSPTFGQMRLSNNTTVELTASATRNITLAGNPGTDFEVATGSELILGSGSPINFNLNADVTAEVFGTVTLTGAAHRFLPTTAESAIFKNGSTFNCNISSGNVFNNSGPSNVVVFESGANYIQTSGANPFGTATGRVNYLEGSNFFWRNANLLSLTGRTFGNLIIDFSGYNNNQNSGSNDLTILGDFHLQNITNFGISFEGNVVVKGNIIVDNGTLTFDLNTGKKLILDGAATQTVSGSGGLILGEDTELEIDNAAGVTLGKNLTVPHKLSVLSGTLSTGSNEIDLGTTGELNEDGGSLLGTVKATKTLAQNDTETFGGIGISINPKGAAMGQTTVTRKTGGAATGLESAPSIGRQYLVDPAENEDLDADVVFTYEQSELATLTNFNDFDGDLDAQGDRLTVYKRPLSGDASSWIALPSSMVDINPASGTISITELPNFSEITLGDSNDPMSNEILPVELIYFKAEPKENEVLLTWKTASEINNHFFEIVRMGSPEKKNKIGRVYGQGTVSSATYYNYVDENPTPGLNYYQLIQTDFDGTETIYGPVAVNIASHQKLKVVSNQTFANYNHLWVSVEPNAPVLYELFDYSGRLIESKTLSPENNLVNIKINKPVKGGLYLLRISQNNQNITEKL